MCLLIISHVLNITPDGASGVTQHSLSATKMPRLKLCRTDCNSIVPQVAARVIAAMVKCDHIGDANEMVRGSIE